MDVGGTVDVEPRADERVDGQRELRGRQERGVEGHLELPFPDGVAQGPAAARRIDGDGSPVREGRAALGRPELHPVRRRLRARRGLLAVQRRRQGCVQRHRHGQFAAAPQQLQRLVQDEDLLHCRAAERVLLRHRAARVDDLIGVLVGHLGLNARDDRHGLAPDADFVKRNGQLGVDRREARCVSRVFPGEGVRTPVHLPSEARIPQGRHAVLIAVLERGLTDDLRRNGKQGLGGSVIGGARSGARGGPRGRRVGAGRVAHPRGHQDQSAQEA